MARVQPDADETIAQVDADARLIEERAGRLPAFEAAVAQVRGTARSQAGDILVQVDADGRVRALQLAEAALGRGARRLSLEILAVIDQAQHRAQKATLDAVGQLLGEDDLDHGAAARRRDTMTGGGHGR